MIENEAPSIAEWRVILADRGLDDLLSEYETSSDRNRRDRLLQFFELCRPPRSPRTPPALSRDLIVKIASDRDLQSAGRLTTLWPGSACAFVLLDQIVPEPEVQLIDLRDALILPDQTVVVDNLYVTHQIRHMSGGWLLSGEGYDLSYLSDLNRSTSIACVSPPEGAVRLPDDRVYFLFQAVVGSLSFGHLIIDTLSQLIVYDYLHDLYGDALTPIIVNPLPHLFKWPGMVWLFEGLVGSQKNVVHLQPHARIEISRGFTSNRLVHLGAGGVSTRSFDYLRKALFRRFHVSVGATPSRRVYVSRKDAGYREADNIDEVEALLALYGFQPIVIQDLSPQQAFDALHDAEIVVGMHGSGLMYCLYTEHPATLIELSYPGFEWQIILACARACGHTPIRIGYKGSRVDIATLRSTLDELEASSLASENT